MPGPLISVIILNWNGLDCIIECIESVERTKYSNIEIIVVDNASTDGSPEKTQKNFPHVKLIKLEKNLGYAAGNNKGFFHAKGKYVVTLNNDVVVEPNWLMQPFEFMETDEKIGIVACRQMSFNNHQIIDGLYSYPHSSLLFQPFGNGKRYSSKAIFSEPGYVIGAGGASAIYRKKLLDELEGFDERYYSYHEESDLCMRAFLSGWKCIYAPYAVVYHKGSFSFNRIRKEQTVFHERNRVWFIYKFFPTLFILKNVIGIFIMELRLLRVLIFKRKVGWSYLRARYQGVLGTKYFREDRKFFTAKFKERQHIFHKYMKQIKLDSNSI